MSIFTTTCTNVMRLSNRDQESKPIWIRNGRMRDQSPKYKSKKQKWNSPGHPRFRRGSTRSNLVWVLSGAGTEYPLGESLREAKPRSVNPNWRLNPPSQAGNWRRKESRCIGHSNPPPKTQETNNIYIFREEERIKESKKARKKGSFSSYVKQEEQECDKLRI